MVNKLYGCRHTGCAKKFLSRSARIYHEKSCGKGPLASPKKKAKKQGSVLKCRYCKAVFKHSASVSRHQKSDCNAARLLDGKLPKVKTPKLKSFNCVICSKSFNRQAKLKAHVVTHEKKKFTCERCFREFKRHDHFLKHSCPNELPSFVIPSTTERSNHVTNDDENEELADRERCRSVDVSEENEDAEDYCIVVLPSDFEEDGNITFGGIENEVYVSEEVEDVEDNCVVVLPSDYEGAANNDGNGIPEGTSDEELEDLEKDGTGDDINLIEEGRELRTNVNEDDVDMEEREDGYVFDDEFSQYFTNCVLGRLSIYKNKSNILMTLLYEYLGEDKR